MRLAAQRAKRLSDAVRPLAQPKVATGNPKREPTLYGIPRTEIPAPQKPENTQDLPEYHNHPLWAFFHDRKSIELADPNRDYAGLFAELLHVSMAAC